jgi:2-polyprenyl-3-methyl-5-hydroxy-6-metoxy-1,4-benzoquinol methylase
MNLIKQKWNLIYQQMQNEASNPAAVLQDHHFLLPDSGRALDLACGLGANACYLAKRGLQTAAWDISDVAISRLQQVAQRKGLSIKTEVNEITLESFQECSFDVIIIARFLDRTLSDGIMSALKPGGLLFYQTFNQEKITEDGPNNPDFLLAENELLTLFAPLRLVYYQENGKIGRLSAGFRNETQFIGQKTVSD